MIVGQEVVCVDADFPSWVKHVYKQLPKDGAVYTIREVRMSREKPKDGAITVGVLLVELSNPLDPGLADPQELGFRAERFVPLEELPPVKEAASHPHQEPIYIPAPQFQPEKVAA